VRTFLQPNSPLTGKNTGILYLQWKPFYNNSPTQSILARKTGPESSGIILVDVLAEPNWAAQFLIGFIQSQEAYRVLLKDERANIVSDCNLLKIGEPSVGCDEGEV
jgi:hypothetical protein